PHHQWHRRIRIRAVHAECVAGAGDGIAELALARRLPARPLPRDRVAPRPLLVADVERRLLRGGGHQTGDGGSRAATGRAVTCGARLLALHAVSRPTHALHARVADGAAVSVVTGGDLETTAVGTAVGVREPHITIL